MMFRSPSQPEGYKIKLLSRRLDSPGDQWHEAEHIVHISGRNKWVNLAIVSGSNCVRGLAVDYFT